MPTFTNRYEAFVITRSSEAPGYQITWVSLGPSDVIDKAIDAWVNWIDYRCSVSNASQVAWYRGVKVGPSKNPQTPCEENLRRLVWEPIEEHLSGVKHVIITPDSNLSRLSWATLPGRNRNRFLLEEYTISMLGHGEELVRNRASKSSSSGRLLAIGGVNYGSAKGPVASYHSIPGSEREARAIVSQWEPGESQLLTGDSATLPAIIKRLRNVEYLHLATHGHFELPHLNQELEARRRDSLRQRVGRPAQVAVRNRLTQTGLALAGANVDSTGYWTGEQIVYRHDLHRIELVALSACHTAAGKVANWSGTYSLQRAFSTAGARSVVGSLWPVHDEATHQLMVLFYDNLAQGMAKAQALRSAQLEIMRNPSKYLKIPAPKNGQLRLSPHLWAGWQLYGDWR